MRLATKIYERVDFVWMLNGDPLLLSHGWKPESGFLKSRWDTFSEDLILYMLAIASPVGVEGSTGQSSGSCRSR